MTFQQTATVKVTAGVTGTKNKISINGITADNFTPEEAKTQLDEFLSLVGITVNKSNMTRTRTEEAVE